MEYLSPVMTSLNDFFKLMDCHLRDFPISLPQIDELHLKNKCAPQIISHTVKYKLHTPQASKLSIPVYPCIMAARIGCQ